MTSNSDDRKNWDAVQTRAGVIVFLVILALFGYDSGLPENNWKPTTGESP